MNKNDLDTLADLATMRDRFRAAEEHETLNRISAEDALKFFFGEQWQDEIERQRRQDGRPCFTLNKLPAILRQILNEAEQNPPAIEISPVSDGAAEDAAEVRQGLCRHVETNGEGSEVAYWRAFLYMVIGGFGSWRVLHDYLPKSFDQDLFLERIPNPFSVYWDPAATKLDKSDARYCFVTKDLGADAFKDQYPDSELSSLNDFSGIGDRAPGWVTRDGCRVVEYYTVETADDVLVKLNNGQSVWEDEIPDGARIAVGPDKKPITRKAQRRRAFRRISNGVEWLEEKAELPTDDIPVVTITADELLVDGEVRIKGAVADLMEAQRMFNYNSSAIAETMALGAKANWLATAEQIGPYQEIWRQSNTRNIAVLPFVNVPGVNPPQKIATEPPIEAMSAARLQSADDLRSISGVFDATQSPNGGEESGKAILARRWQTSTGNSHYLKALARGVKRTAQILLKYFPKIYDTGRIMRIMGADLQPQQVVVHAGQPDTVPQVVPNAVKGVYDLSVGMYDVRVSVGPSHETKRKESVDMLLTLAQANPAMVPIIGDLIVNEMDFSGKKAVVERLQRALPPGLQDQNGNADPNQLAAHNAQLMQQNQALMQKVQQITQVLQTKQIESASRERVESMKLEAARERSAGAVQQESIKAQASLLTAAAKHTVDIVHDHAMASSSQEHERAMAQLNQVHSMMSANHAAALAPPAPAAPMDKAA